MNKTKNISEFGYSFQVKFIVCLITDKLFLEQIVDILDEKYIDNDGFKWIVKEIREYYNEYKTTITMEVFKIKIKEIESELLQVNVKDSLKEIFKSIEADDLEYIKDKALEFHKTQVLKDAVIQSAQILEMDGNTDEIKSLIDSAMQAGVERNLGHDYLVDIEERYSDTARITSPTPWDIINELMQGGLGAGELGVVVAPAGIGKSWVLSAMGAYAISQGLNVVHYTLELNEAYVGLRYDSIFTGVESQNLKYHKEEVMEKLYDLLNSFKKGNTVADIRKTLEKELGSMENFEDLDKKILDSFTEKESPSESVKSKLVVAFEEKFRANNAQHLGIIPLRNINLRRPWTVFAYAASVSLLLYFTVQVGFNGRYVAIVVLPLLADSIREVTIDSNNFSLDSLVHPNN